MLRKKIILKPIETKVDSKSNYSWDFIVLNSGKANKFISCYKDKEISYNLICASNIQKPELRLQSLKVKWGTSSLVARRINRTIRNQKCICSIYGYNNLEPLGHLVQIYGYNNQGSLGQITVRNHEYINSIHGYNRFRNIRPLVQITIRGH